ncbi:hypothetical protein GUJ93_ZPchr0011g26952 [Zizania palustris]|uniref:Uncharacterized protein n=1 Tax=Zizania palustris TaxID=103762 RepID=A0A8J5WJM6_ZIZPA|nr:hypothetical protein GUJ93_ZPchr0011g26952 [Zizania palustris]
MCIYRIIVKAGVQPKQGIKLVLPLSPLYSNLQPLFHGTKVNCLTLLLATVTTYVALVLPPTITVVNKNTKIYQRLSRKPFQPLIRLAGSKGLSKCSVLSNSTWSDWKALVLPLIFLCTIPNKLYITKS